LGRARHLELEPRQAEIDALIAAGATRDGRAA